MFLWLTIFMKEMLDLELLIAEFLLQNIHMFDFVLQQYFNP